MANKYYTLAELEAKGRNSHNVWEFKATKTGFEATSKYAFRPFGNKVDKFAVCELSITVPVELRFDLELHKFVANLLLKQVSNNTIKAKLLEEAKVHGGDFKYATSLEQILAGFKVRTPKRAETKEELEARALNTLTTADLERMLEQKRAELEQAAKTETDAPVEE